MAGDRLQKVAALLRDLAAEFINEDSNRASLITVTKATVAKDLSRSTIFISVFPDDKEAAALDYLKRQRPEMREYIKKHAHLKTIPFFEVELDAGEKHRQHVDELLREDQ